MGYLTSLIKTKVYRVFHKTILFRFGFGNRTGKAVWEKEYSNGSWKYLDSEEQKGHYDAIIKQIKAHTKTPDILDIGCGHGVLYRYFTNSPNFNFSYTGIDISDNAVQEALKSYPKVDFKSVDYDFNRVDDKFNIIVFNEVLYYFVKPIKTLYKAFKENISGGGALIISMYDDVDNKNKLIWKDIENSFKVVKTDVVKNDKGVSWTIKTVTL